MSAIEIVYAALVFGLSAGIILLLARATIRGE